MCYHFDDIIKFEGYDFDNILTDEKSRENILIYNISHRTLIHPKPFRIRFDKIDGFIRVYDRSRYLISFASEKYYAIYNRIRCLISLKKQYHICFFSLLHEVDSYDPLSIEETLTLHNALILIKSVLNQNQNHYYFNIFLEKFSYQLAET